MNSPRPGTPGATRACPHCRELILESAAVCPACKHHVRFDAGAAGASDETVSPLTIEGSFVNPAGDQAWEYSVVIAIRNDKGVEVARKLIGVGALNPDEKRTFSLTVEMAPAKPKLGAGKPAIPRGVMPAAKSPADKSAPKPMGGRPITSKPVPGKPGPFGGH
jgi:hypothetical protein